MNRIRHAYLELAPELEPYFVTSRHDDVPGVLLSSVGTPGPMPLIQPFVAIPGVVALIDCVVAGAAVGIACIGLDLGVGWSLALGGAAFMLTVAGFVAWGIRSLARYTAELEPRFPAPS